MYELEVKVPTPLEPVRETLERLDGEFLGVVEQRDRYYDPPGQSFGDSDEALRIREEDTPDGSRALLTYKGPRLDAAAKTREEVETQVVDAPSMDEILRRSGFTPVATVEKSRERYRLADVTVVLDSVTDVGTFVEVEATATGADRSAAREAVEAGIATLGLESEPQTTTSYLELLLENN